MFKILFISDKLGDEARVAYVDSSATLNRISCIEVHVIKTQTAKIFKVQVSPDEHLTVLVNVSTH